MQIKENALGCHSLVMQNKKEWMLKICLRSIEEFWQAAEMLDFGQPAIPLLAGRLIESANDEKSRFLRLFLHDEQIFLDFSLNFENILKCE